jgi:hypothetical protein
LALFFFFDELKCDDNREQTPAEWALLWATTFARPAYTWQTNYSVLMIHD